MKRKIDPTRILLVLLLAFANLAYGQNNSKFQIDLLDFQDKSDLANQLIQYDVVAWETSDSLVKEDQDQLNQLSKHWFCLQQDGLWHAIYGKYKEGAFQTLFHYKEVGQKKYVLTEERLDSVLLSNYARVLESGFNEVRKRNSGVKLNHYILQNEDQSWNVIFLPAIREDGTVLSRIEFNYTFSPDGQTLIQDDSFFKQDIVSYQIDKTKEVQLNYVDVDQATLGAIYFASYFKYYFAKITIETAKNFSMPIQSGNSWTWIHGEKSQPKAKKQR